MVYTDDLQLEISSDKAVEIQSTGERYNLYVKVVFNFPHYS